MTSLRRHVPADARPRGPGHQTGGPHTGGADGRPTTRSDAAPILIGGGGERKTLRFVAKYGDATHQTTSDPGVMRHKMEVLRRHCETEGRDFDEIERYCGLNLRPASGQTGSIADASTVLERASALTAAGSQGVFVVLPSVADTDSIERFGSEVIAASA